MTGDRPPIPRWALVWTAADWTATGSDRHPAFAYTEGNGHDLAAIRATTASMTAWRECAHAWCEAAGYTFAEHFAAREVATGTTEDTCAAVAFTSDGRPVCIPAPSLGPEPGGRGVTSKTTPTRPGRHSNSLSGTPETNGPPGGAP